jgi:hypothetical protein
MAVRTKVAGVKNKKRVGVGSALPQQGTTHSRKKTLRRGESYRALLEHKSPLSAKVVKRRPLSRELR